MTTVWLVLGILFFIGEIFTPGFYLASLGVSAVIAALPAHFACSFTVQLIVFAAALVVTMLLLRPVLYRTFMKNHQKSTNAERMIGRIVSVERGIEPGEKGRVKVDGESWFAVSEDTIKENEKAKIIKIEGTVLTVKKE